MRLVRLAQATGMAVALCLGTVCAALAVTPTTESYAIDSSFTPPILSAACGFDVTRHVFGTLTIRTYTDKAGNFVREVDSYKLTETLTANGITLTGKTVQQIYVGLLPDGGFTVTVVGSDFRLALRGSGISFGAVGRLVLVFDANGDLTGVTQDVGDARADYSAICAALTPST
jgi:hypothetical protein